MHHSTQFTAALQHSKAALLRKGKALLSLLGLSVITSAAFAQGTWTPLASTAPFYNQGVMILLNDGSVLVKTSGGGSDGIGSGWDRLRPDIHGSYINGSWTTATGMSNSRLYFSSQVLKNGTIYVAGGEYGTGRPFAEVYYVNDDTWLPTLPLLDPTDTISDANSEILPDGRVLQAVVLTGHSVSHRTYIYDPVSSSFTAGPNTIGVANESAWVKLPDNSILFPDVYSTNAERYIPGSNSWVHDAPLPLNIYDPYGLEMGASFLLPDRRAFLIGSTSTTAYYTPSGTTTPGTWTAGPAIPDGLGAPDAAAAMMVNGKILCAFSRTPVFDTVFFDRMNFFEFDYLTNTFTKILSPEGGDSIETASYCSNMLCLPDGSVLYARQGDDQYYVYKPDGSPLAAGKPTITNIINHNCDTFVATGTLFNGISEGAGYGDDWQMATNYPIVRISRHDTVYYASTYNWNSTGVMRGSLPDTTQFVLPVGIPQGTYQLQVIANGIASSPVSFTFCEGVGISNVAKNAQHISVYPNPASDEVTVNYTAATGGEYTLKLTDIYGRQVLLQNHTAIAGDNTTTIPLTGYARGIYTATIQAGDVMYTTKVVIK